MTDHPVMSELDEQLRALIDESWREYAWHRCKAFVVTSSIPILFFGDLRRYSASPIRIVTVGLNPSRIEFPDADRFRRFPEASGLNSAAKDETFYRRYITALSDYFRTDPYMKWFNAYEYILHGLDGSYCDCAPNTVVHTDICSPLATDPTWSRLSADDRSELESHGASLWRRLIAYLAPDVLLISVAQNRLDNLPFGPATPWETVYTIVRDNPYHVKAKKVRVVEGKDTFIIFGRAANTPFGTVSNVDKRALGVRMKEYIRG